MMCALKPFQGLGHDPFEQFGAHCDYRVVVNLHVEYCLEVAIFR
jgi:hypothetical protein